MIGQSMINIGSGRGTRGMRSWGKDGSKAESKESKREQKKSGDWSDSSHMVSYPKSALITLSLSLEFVGERQRKTNKTLPQLSFGARDLEALGRG